MDATWEQQQKQFLSLVASSVLKMFYKHNNIILNSTPEQLQLHTQLTNREGERMFSVVRRVHDNHSLETRAVVIKSAIQVKQVLDTYPNLLIDLAKEIPERYLNHQSNARKILDAYPTRAEIDSAKFRLSDTKYEDKRQKNETKEKKASHEKPYLDFLKRIHGAASTAKTLLKKDMVAFFHSVEQRQTLQDLYDLYNQLQGTSIEKPHPPQSSKTASAHTSKYLQTQLEPH